MDIKKEVNSDSILKIMKSVFPWLKQVNHDYGSLLLIITTIFLVYVTYQYVQLTRDSLNVLQDQVSIIRKDYQVRSYPEIYIHTPKERTQGDEKGVEFTIVNKGFQATGVRVKVIVCYNRVPTTEKVGLLYQTEGRPFYSDEEIFRLGNETGYSVFISDKYYVLSDGLGFLIFLTYDIPLSNESKQDFKYFQWNSHLNHWQGFTDDSVADIIEQVYQQRLLEGF